MRKVWLIGIGAGDPAWMTVAAIGALRSADVCFVLEKDVDDLVAVRRQILDRYGSPRVVAVPDPPRGRDVEAWRRERAAVVERLLDGEDGVGAFLVWGDPSLYDGMIDVLERVGCTFEVVPGISAVSALAARFRIALNRVGGAVLVTTGRRIADGFPRDADDVVVMLDAANAFTRLDPDLDIYWGAYLGTPDEILVSGRLGDVAEEIVRVRAQARTRKGWMFDTYLLRKR